MVNKTSLICIGIGLANALLPMDEINDFIFGKYAPHTGDFGTFEEMEV